MKKATTVVLVPNWRAGSGYEDHGERTDRWAWEFLRRNPEYVADWQKYVAIVDAVRQELIPPGAGLPDEWKGQAKDPHWWVDCVEDPRLTVYDPPRYDQESKDDWKARVSKGRTMLLHQWYGEKWGLDKIADPKLSRFAGLHRWISVPWLVLHPGGHPSGQDVRMILALATIKEWLSVSPVDQASINKVLAYIDKKVDDLGGIEFKVPASWPVDWFGKFTLQFDMTLPIAEQINHAKARLILLQDRWKSTGGQVFAKRRNKETPGYGTYIRVLDAIAEFEGKKTELVGAIVEVFKKNIEDVEVARKGVRAWITRAEWLRDTGYRQLVAITTRKPISEPSKKARSGK